MREEKASGGHEQGKGQQKGGGGQKGAVSSPGRLPDKTATGDRRKGVTEPDSKTS
jgi:hypothetical protein